MRRLGRVFFEGALSDVVELPEAETKKLKNVLRAKQGDEVEILTEDFIASAELGAIGKRSVQAFIKDKRPIIKPDYKLTAYQCAAKRGYMDFIIEKYSELGVTDIVPVVSARGLNVFKGGAMERWKIIAREAALQCERETIADIHQPIKLERIKASASDNILFHERLGKQAMPSVTGRDIAFIIGPEGGFTESEYNLLISRGFTAYTPIDTVLKAETAALIFAGLIRINL